MRQHPQEILFSTNPRVFEVLKSKFLDDLGHWKVETTSSDYTDKAIWKMRRDTE